MKFLHLNVILSLFYKVCCRRGLRLLLPAAILLYLAAGNLSSVQAATVAVVSAADSGAGSLREAIDAANDGDTIVFDISGTGPHTIQLASALPPLNKNVTISGPADRSVTVRGGEPLEFDLFTVEAQGQVSFSGLTISLGQNGIASYGTATVSNCAFTNNKYALYSNAGTDSVTNSSFSGNRTGVANSGGNVTVANNSFSFNSNGVYCLGGSVAVENCGFTNNTTAIANSEGAVTAIGSTFFDNTYGTYSNGGSIALTNCTLGRSTYGVVNTSGTSSVMASTISHSSRGLYVGGGVLTATRTTITHSTFFGVHSSTGILNLEACALLQNAHGIYNHIDTVSESPDSTGATVVATNCTFSGNAHGLHNSYTATLTNCTLSENGIGIWNDGSLSLKNSIVAGNAHLNVQGSITDLGHNLTSGEAGLGALRDNGGPTFTHALHHGSPAINAGDNNAAPATDQRGKARPVGGTVDIGAYEVEATYSISGLVKTSTAAPVVGVAVHLYTAGRPMGSAVTTNSAGFYRIDNVPAGSYRVMPVLAGWSFAPTSIPVEVSEANATADFTAVRATYRVSGRITRSGGLPTPLVNVGLAPVNGGATRTTITDILGNYAFSDVPAGDYRLSPSLSDTSFSPLERTVKVTTTAIAGQDFVAATAYLNHILSTGQSLSLGGGGGPALSVWQPYSNLMLNRVATAGSFPAPAALTEAMTESPGSGMANHLAARTKETFVVSSHGVSGACYNLLEKNTSTGVYAYEHGMRQLQAVRNWALQRSKPYRVLGVTAIHGECDEREGQGGRYQADLEKWQRDYETDVRAYTGQGGDLPLFTDQMSSFTYYGRANPTVAIAQLKAARENPGKIVLVGPKYHLPYEDGVHLTNRSYRWLGEYFGKVIKQHGLEGQLWRPLSPRQITRSGAVITARFYVPVAPLKFDTSLVLEKANYGFEYVDNSGAPPAIQSVEIVGSDTVRITLSVTPTATNGRLRYAFTGTPGAQAGPQNSGAARGNLRDSDATLSDYGDTLYNWAVHFDEPILVSGPTYRYTVGGYIRTTTGQPIAGATVRLNSTTLSTVPTVATNTNGYYHFDNLLPGTYVVTPMLAGNAFEPTSRTVSLTDDDILGVSFTGYAPRKITGRAVTPNGLALANVLIVPTGGTLLPTLPVVTNSAGYFTFTGVPGETYTLTASRLGYLFLPPTRSVTVGATDIGNQNFQGSIGVTVSGRIATGAGTAIGGATVTRVGAILGILPQTVQTNSAGYFSFTNVPAGTLTLTAAKTGYRLTPLSRSVNVGTTDVVGQNFTAASGFTLTGRIANRSGVAQAGIAVRRTGSSVAALTNSAGYYTFTDVPNGAVTITPSGTGVSYTPESRTVTVSGADINGLNFVHAPGYNIIGRVATSSGAALPGAQVTRSGSTTVAVANSAGYFTFSGVGAGTYTLSATLNGYRFTPANRQITVGSADVTGQNFIGVTP